MNKSKKQPITRPTITDFLFYLLCAVLILCGMYFRFNWNNWNEGASLHPDEYGLTNTLTALKMPDSLSGYFNTRLSPISPYDKYDIGGQKAQNGADNRMRWGQFPIILLRWAGELSGNTGYDEIRLLGRRLSALADALSVLLIFLGGRCLFNWKTGLLAAALSSLAVMQIQQSHFMTVDNFAAFFAVLAVYTCLRISQIPAVQRVETGGSESARLKINRPIWKWCALFGMALGMAAASKINLAVLAGMLPVALSISIADIRLKYKDDFNHIMRFTLLLLLFSAFVSLLTFRVTQPMSFRSPQGDTSFFTLHFNQDWMDSMQVARAESSGEGGGPPAEQWAHRPIILFPLMNMVFWGMGLPLGASAWLGFLFAAWLVIKKQADWRQHLIPLVWTGGYFFFMATRWVKSMRYFLPIYPVLCLFAAWGLLWLWQRAAQSDTRHILKRTLAGLCFVTVTGGTLLWAHAFTRAVYAERNTRLLATEWIFSHIPGAAAVTVSTADGDIYQPITVYDNFNITQEQPAALPFTALEDGELLGVYLADASSSGAASLRAAVSHQQTIDDVMAETRLEIDNATGGQRASFETTKSPVTLKKGEQYFLLLKNLTEYPVSLSKIVLANESWDESLPVRLAGIDPFGQLYHGINMEVRWYDDENKRLMFIQNLEKADYIIMPSQRAIWSACRIPRTYPMTLEYYRALFDGRLGFELVAQFDHPMHIGKLYISDVGGTFAWDEEPELPLFNFNPLAAEEAFSVYDHPPVWIFKKSDDFDIYEASRVLYGVDLSGVVVESPRNATW